MPWMAAILPAIAAGAAAVGEGALAAGAAIGAGASAVGGALGLTGATLPAATTTLGLAAEEGGLITAGMAGSAVPIGGAAGSASFPWLSAISTGGQMLSGISERLSQASQRRAEAKALEAQGRYNEALSLRRDARIIGKQQAIAGASGVDPGSGSPLAIMMDSVRGMLENSVSARYGSQIGASSRRAEAETATNPLGIAGEAFNALNTKSGSILTDWVRQRYGF